MAELDLYGDLYGDVEDPGSPVDLPPSDHANAGPEHSISDTKPSYRNGESAGSHPTTFSIATYEDQAYVNKKPDISQSSANESSWHAPPHSARVPTSPARSSSISGGAGGRSGMWGVKPSDMPDEGKMFVGGLNWETSEDTLKHYFSQFGAVVHCTIMRDPTNGRSRGFAFLTFADPAVVNKVMVKEHFLDGKLIDPKRAIPRGSGPIPSGLASSSAGDKRSGHYFSTESPASLSNKLFCRGMPDDTTPQSFRSYWAQFGSEVNIEEAVLMMDRDTNRHRGFGFVNLVTGDDADQLLKCGPFVMDGHPLEVKKKAPSRSRYESREEMGKMGHGPVDRYGTYPASGHHDLSSFNSNSMSEYFKFTMAGPSWKGWNSGMPQPMGPSRSNYMGMGMHDDRGGRGMGYEGSGGMSGSYSGGPYRSGQAYNSDWRGPPSQGMRSGPPGPYSSSYHHQHAPPPPSVGPARSQRSSHGMFDYRDIGIIFDSYAGAKNTQSSRAYYVFCNDFVSRFTLQLAKKFNRSEPTLQNDYYLQTPTDQPSTSVPFPRAQTVPTSSILYFLSISHQFVTQLEQEGLSRKQAEGLIVAIEQVIDESIKGLIGGLVTRNEIEKQQYTQRVDFAKLKSEIQLVEKQDFALLKSENERLLSELEKLKQRLREEITRTQASVRLDLNLEKGRIRDELGLRELKIREVDTRIEGEIGNLRTTMESVKFNILQYVVGTVASSGALLLAYIRMFR
ncbi:hypothetical protein CROQUDRAFT_105647 [Cronartium quercuum f. sp. fusiforme G11]|uniref:RRM domain-containing protein n=1 Tax=Cronartium quercuum f. sp. fusiforme G11 TaxID=708437 RepID=A0A9P6NQP3_9BASI|nr:hypothetical protein CROQUDRAFT_105647 [Cronartium quercuum f. sp. fusiforme G11]